MRAATLASLVFVMATLAAGCSDGDSSPTAEPVESFAILRESLTWTTPDLDPQLVGTEVQATSAEEWPMMVAYPDGSQPPLGRPVIVYFHGSTSGTPFDGLDRLAADGSVVVVPRWVLPEWNASNLEELTAAEYADGYWFDVAACALAAAQEVAREFDGNTQATTVVGFSAGVHAAAWTTLAPPRNDLCPDRDPVDPPHALVLGDSQLLFQGEQWDETFNAPDSLASDTVDRFLNPDRWVGQPDGFKAYLWSTESTAWARDLDNPPDTDSWFASRNPGDADLIDDLSDVGAFEDGQIMFDDTGRLLAKRLEQEGIPVTHEIFPTDHTYTAGVYERIKELAIDGE